VRGRRCWGLVPFLGIQGSAFARSEALISTDAALARVAGTVPAAMVSDHATSTSLAARSFSAQTFDFDLPVEPWVAVTGPNECVPSVSTGGVYDLSGAARSIYELALDFRLNGDATAGAEARTQLLAFVAAPGASGDPDFGDLPAGAGGVWTNNAVGVASHPSVGNMPTSLVHPTEPDWGVDANGDPIVPAVALPFVGPEMGDPDSVTRCLPAWQRVNGGAC